MNNQRIADRLNAKKVPSPATRKLQSGTKLSLHFRKSDEPPWSAKAVDRILHNEVYIGKLVQGKTRRLDYRSKKKIKNHKDAILALKKVHDAGYIKVQNASEYYREHKPREDESSLDDMLPNFILWGALFLICGFGFVRAKTHQYLVADLKAMFGTIIVSIAVVTSIRRLMASGYDLVGCLFEFLNRYFILNDVLIVIQYFVPYFFMNRSAIASVNNRAYFDQLTGLLGINGTTRWDIWSIAIIIPFHSISSLISKSCLTWNGWFAKGCSCSIGIVSSAP